jgi:hypothetical protein
LFVLALVFGKWPLWPVALGIMMLRLITQAVIFYRSMVKLNERDLFPLFLFFDIFQLFQYIIFIPALLRKPKPVWK